MTASAATQATPVVPALRHHSLTSKLLPRARNTGINTHLPYLLVSLVANHTLPLSSGRYLFHRSFLLSRAFLSADFDLTEQSYGGAPPGPVYSPPRDKPPIPQGWIPQFDQQHQRWYYVEEASGRSQWEAPGFNSGGGSDTRGHDPSYGGGGGGPGYGAPPPQQYGGYPGSSPYPQQQEKQKSGSSGMLLGAAGGIAAGAVGGALLANALGSSGSISTSNVSKDEIANIRQTILTTSTNSRLMLSNSHTAGILTVMPRLWLPRQLTRMITPRSQKRVRNIRKP